MAKGFLNTSDNLSDIKVSGELDSQGFSICGIRLGAALNLLTIRVMALWISAIMATLIAFSASSLALPKAVVAALTTLVTVVLMFL